MGLKIQDLRDVGRGEAAVHRAKARRQSLAAPELKRALRVNEW